MLCLLLPRFLCAQRMAEHRRHRLMTLLHRLVYIQSSTCAHVLCIRTGTGTSTRTVQQICIIREGARSSCGTVYCDGGHFVGSRQTPHALKSSLCQQHTVQHSVLLRFLQSQPQSPPERCSVPSPSQRVLLYILCSIQCVRETVRCGFSAAPALRAA